MSYVRVSAVSPKKYRAYLVAAQPSPARTNADIERVLDQAKDWCRFGPKDWIIITSKSPDVWRQRLEKAIGPAGELLICALDLSNVGGVMSEDFWLWVAKWTAESKTA